MPAVSKVQQRAAGAELARRRSGKRAGRFTSMTTEKLKEFASTKRKGLPYRAESGKQKLRRKIAEIRSRKD